MPGPRAQPRRCPSAQASSPSSAATPAVRTVTAIAAPRLPAGAVTSSYASSTARAASPNPSTPSRTTAARSVAGSVAGSPGGDVMPDSLPPGTVPAMRALLLVNPKATTTTERGRDVLVRALRSEVDLAVAYTRRRGHATALARDAARDGLDLVVTLGGDGTVNEAVNGLMAEGEYAEDRPALAVVPGGSTNVFARALGLPGDWAEGTGVILEALREGRTRTIGLGRADDRYFTFCAGVGLDAEVVHRVERARLRGR